MCDNVKMDSRVNIFRMSDGIYWLGVVLLLQVYNLCVNSEVGHRIVLAYNYYVH